MRTEFTVKGADCPACLNETLDHLRGLPEVSSAEASSVNGCLVVQHDDMSLDELIDQMRDHLHGTSLASNEIVMTDLVPEITVLHCSH
jgi:cation transport ATPase